MDYGEYIKSPWMVQKDGAIKCKFEGCDMSFWNLNEAEKHPERHRDNQSSSLPQSSVSPTVSDVDVLKADYRVREELSKSASIISIRDVLKLSAEDKLLVYVPSLDKNVEFKPMSVADYLEYKGIKDQGEQNVEFVWRNLRGVIPSLTKEEVKTLGYHVVSDLVTAIDTKISFLQIGKLLEQSKKMGSQ